MSRSDFLSLLETQHHPDRIEWLPEENRMVAFLPGGLMAVYERLPAFKQIANRLRLVTFRKVRPDDL